jgi:hypothetical protein
MKPIMYVCMVALLASCSKILPDLQKAQLSSRYPGFTEYVIPKDKQYANGHTIKKVELDALRFMVIFDSTSIYKTVKAENQNDINKLYGFSDSAAHHENSARVGWRWNGSAIELHAYCYANGKRASKLMGTVELGREEAVSIRVKPGQYLFDFNGKTVTMDRGRKETKAIGYQLYPYFGGDETAPHEIRIYIREVES